MRETAAIKHLKKDKVMAAIIRNHKLKPWPKVKLTPQYIFEDIVETILGQQLSGKAADTIIGRFKELFGGKLPRPKELLKTSDKKIRSCGTSWSKAAYVKNVARAVEKGELKLNKLAELSDEEVRRELLAIKGVGDWTAEMVMMFSLRRPDIFSTGDMGLQNAMHKFYRVKKGDTKKMLEVAEQWRPYRSLAARYLWKGLDSQ